MTIVDFKDITDTVRSTYSATIRRVCFIRVAVDDLQNTMSGILSYLLKMSWLDQFPEPIANAYQLRAEETIQEIKSRFENHEADRAVDGEIGEYIISVTSLKTIEQEMRYKAMPLAELLGKKVAGNPGFDFYNQNCANNIIIFGEAKYLSNHNAYGSALRQINAFDRDQKDIKDLPEINAFCKDEAINNAWNGLKGFAAAFSATEISSEELLNHIFDNADFQQLLKHDEIILVAVNL